MAEQAVEQWQLVVVPDSRYDSNTVLPQIHREIHRRLTEQMGDANFEVFSTDYAGLPDCFSQDCSDLSDKKIKELIDITGRDINLALLYQVVVAQEQGPSVTRYRIRVEGRILDLESGSELGAFPAQSTQADLNSGCTGFCFEDWLAQQAGILAQDVGSILSEKLAAQTRRFRYRIEAKDFLPSELNQINRFLEQTDGYVSHKLLSEKRASKQFLHQISSHEYRFVSEIPGSTLRDNLEQFMLANGIPMVVSYADRNRQFVFSRTQMPYLAGYLSFIVLLSMLSYLLYAFTQRRKHDRVLKRYAMGQHAGQWLDYFDSTKIPLAPRKKTWFEEQKNWLDKVKRSEQLAEEAWLLSDQHEYDAAIQKLEQALSENVDNQRARDLKKQVSDFERGYKRFVMAESELQSHPASALSLLQEARHLNPSLEQKVQEKIAQCERLMHEQLGNNALQNARAAFEAGRDFEVLSVIDKTQLQIGNLTSFAQEQAELLTLREQILKRQQPVLRAFRGTGALNNFIFLADDTIQLARNTEDEAASIVLGFKRISRFKKQSAITKSGNDFYVTDLGSANGTRYNGMAVDREARVKLEHEGVIALGGSKTGGGSICSLQCMGSNESSSLVLRLKRDGLAFIDDTSTGQSWPSMDEDFEKTWVLVNGHVPIGVNKNGQLDVGGFQNSELLAQLSYQNGFYITPMGVTMDATELTINGVDQYSTVPLVENANVGISAITFGIQEIK
ncbi:hypothetical protein MACH26_19010 [Planctobacterium marinum]|uniref:FHA domain-containing protein n=1 Tax=Planctobacterium marinum TaxID=1631968 RepID=A0AA48KUE9_9ALTE|nr:hypothetical protein MACH26_19010 [Planctobacterium marinum]